MRLGLSVLAGMLIGINRSQHGRPAGLRTTLLVCLAACVAMIQTDLLLSTMGKTPEAFSVMDVMRLPLGILSGMGFIGGGVILKRDNLVLGVTTAATLWFTTVLGLCFGGGQLALGSVALVIGLIVLWGVSLLENRIHRDRLGLLKVIVDERGITEEELRRRLGPSGYHVVLSAATYENHNPLELQFEVAWRGLPREALAPGFLSSLAQDPQISRLEWKPIIS